MTVLDAYAVIAFLRGEAVAEHVRPLLDAGDSVLSAVGLAEVMDHLVRLYGADEEDAALDLAELGLLDAVAVDAVSGAAAGRLRARYYHRGRCAVSMADCVAAEIARRTATSLATSDPHLLDVCHAERIQVHPLPATDGSIWTPSP